MNIPSMMLVDLKSPALAIGHDLLPESDLLGGAHLLGISVETLDVFDGLFHVQ